MNKYITTKLTKIADELDKLGFYKQAELIDHCLMKDALTRNKKDWGLTKHDVDDMLRSFYRRNQHLYANAGEYYKRTPFEIGMELDSDYHSYVRYLKQLPEGIGAADVIEAYREKLLPYDLPAERQQRVPDLFSGRE